MPRFRISSLTRTALLVTAGLGLATLCVHSPAVAQEARADAERDGGTVTFPTVETMQLGVAQEVERGNLTQEQGDMILRIHQRLIIGLENGSLTVPEAFRIMEERGRAVYADGTPEERSIDLDELKAAIEGRLKALGTELRAKVASGELTDEQAKTQYAEAEKEMWTRYREAEMRMTTPTVDLDELKAGIETRIKAMREQLAGMVASDQITQEDADARMAAAEKALWERYRQEEMNQRGGAKERSITKADYDEAVRKMTEMVEAGEITREQMQQRLEQMRKMMTPEKTITRQDYADAAARMEKMVEAGEITREQMQQRLEEMRKMITRDAGERSEVSDDCRELRRRLGEAMRAGEMTREEAAEIWRNEGC